MNNCIANDSDIIDIIKYKANQKFGGKISKIDIEKTGNSFTFSFERQDDTSIFEEVVADNFRQAGIHIIKRF